MDGRNKFMAAGLEAIERILEQQGQQAWEQADEFDEFVSEADEDVTHERTSYRPSPAPSHRTTPAPSPTTHAATTGADLPSRVPDAGGAGTCSHNVLCSVRVCGSVRVCVYMGVHVLIKCSLYGLYVVKILYTHTNTPTQALLGDFIYIYKYVYIYIHVCLCVCVCVCVCVCRLRPGALARVELRAVPAGSLLRLCSLAICGLGRVDRQCREAGKVSKKVLAVPTLYSTCTRAVSFGEKRNKENECLGRLAPKRTSWPFLFKKLYICT